MANLKQVFLEICQSIVTKKEAVKVEEESIDGLERVVISVDPEDMGIIIGKGGRTIKALRRLAGILGVKSGKKIMVELAEHAS